ncbi:hypothetical protein CG723_38300 [Streptomyces sp. CB01635]|uniref:hypothetical protein n=1 Tax=unclassified Streptomyces TaxID=2593676 RepID=UPI000C27286E|nr:hypothetical protein [Streptomyces sp. CB01635]PJN06558.1 hypothetical protein CG723_38300 [Streptomyces sp. CB01635]
MGGLTIEWTKSAMRGVRVSLTAGIGLLALSACAGPMAPQQRQAESMPTPGKVPKGPRFATAGDLVAAMEKAGLDCETVRSRDYDGSSTTDCVATVDGVKVENEISVFDPDVVSKTEIGTSIESRRTGAYAQTLVAAGNWYIRVMDPPSAPAVAKALHAVVLDAKGKGAETPKYPLPRIPSTPTYKKVDTLADDVAASVGCFQRETTSTGSIKCETGKPGSGSTDCAVLTLHPTHARRDAALREAIKYRGVPAELVTAGNWTVNLCDTTLGGKVARDLGGVVVAYDGR